MKTMNLFKIISLVLVSQLESLSESQKQKLEVVKIELRQEVLTIVLKIFVGLALTVGIVTSTLHLGDSLRVQLSQFQNQFVYELLSFGFFGLLCSLFLFLLFKNDLVKKDFEDVPCPSSKQVLNLEILLVNFLEGFLDGFEKPTHENKKEDIV